MGYKLNILDIADGSLVTLTITFTRQESNELFLSGDSMVSWPEDGLRSKGDSILARTSIFISEISARPEGIILHYQSREQAEKSAYILQFQLHQAGIARED